jgi:hypothetical protein
MDTHRKTSAFLVAFALLALLAILKENGVRIWALVWGN